MKTPIQSSSARWCRRYVLPAVIAAILLPAQSFAAQLFWDATPGNGVIDSGSGTWYANNIASTNWSGTSTGATNTYWTSGTATQAVFGGAAGAVGAYVINVDSNITAQGLRFISTGYLLSSTTAVTITVGYAGNTAISVAPGVTTTIGDNVSIVGASGQQVTISNTTAAVTGTVLIQATSPSSLAIVKAQLNNNVSIVNGVNVVVGQNGVLQTGSDSVVGIGNMVVGTGSDATLTVNGGTVNFGSLVMANAAATGVSTLTINSGVAKTMGSGTTAGVLRFANTSNTTTSGTAIVNLNGGTFSVAGIYIGKAGAAQYQLNLNGGTLQVAGSSSLAPTFLAASSQITASVLAGGAVVDTNGYNATIAQGLVSGTTNDGGLTKKGNGTLTLTGTNTYNGATTVQSGSLVVATTSNISNSLVLGGAGGLTGTLDVSAKGAFSETNISGAGTIIATTVTATGNVTPGVDIGTLNVSGNFTLAGTASTQMQIGGASTLDLINVSGLLTYNGALVISSYDGFDLTKTGLYDLFNFGSKSGDFNSVTVNGVSLALTGNTWSDGSGTYSFDESTGVLSVVPEPGTYAMLLSGIGMLGLLRRKLRA